MISIIIPTYNEADVIKSCLASLGRQSVHGFEVIVVDDGSTDKTSEVLQNFQFPISTTKLVEYFQLKIITGDHKGAGVARNLGVKSATGDILVFVDADMTFNESFLEKLTEPIRKNYTKGTFSKDEYVSNWENVWARCWNINEGWEKRHRHPKNYPDKQPVFRAILKSEFDKVGGFTPGGYDDDWSLGRKLGYEADVASGAVLYHKNPSSLSEVFKHAKWVGKRKYKSGMLGYVVALVRSSLPISILIGLYKGLMSFELRFLIFKLVYDFGIFVGIVEFIITRKSSK